MAAFACIAFEKETSRVQVATAAAAAGGGRQPLEKWPAAGISYQVFTRP